ncbi:FbpB family small basic protein [Bacillus sp. CRN 9]|nr:FbpB family small basic protein [Bacillus sp. CRN 9]
MRLYKFKHRSHRIKQSLAELIETNKQELLNNQLYIDEIERKLENKQVAMQKERL